MEWGGNTQPPVTLRAAFSNCSAPSFTELCRSKLGRGCSHAMLDKWFRAARSTPLGGRLTRLWFYWLRPARDKTPSPLLRYASHLLVGDRMKAVGPRRSPTPFKYIDVSSRHQAYSSAAPSSGTSLAWGWYAVENLGHLLLLVLPSGQCLGPSPIVNARESHV
jgi:hypothetical protein